MNKVAKFLVVVFILTTALICCTSALAADSGTCGTNVNWFLDDSGTLSITGSGAMTDYSNKSDTPWYDSRSSIKTIIISHGVIHIGGYAFYDCSSLASISIPDSVTSIGNSAFERCSGLTSIILPDNLSSISTYAFSGCSGLTSIVIPNSVIEVDICAFSFCTSLTSITLSNRLPYISLWAFFGCTSLTSFTIPDSITEIGNGAFDGCTSLASILIPDSVTFIDEYAFRGCSSLTSISIPNSVTEIYDYTFANCSSLTSVTIPNSVNSISEFAFDNCEKLDMVVVEGHTLNVGGGIKSFGISGNIKYLIGNNNTLFVYGTGTIPNYYSQPGAPWLSSDITHTTILEGVTGIGNYAFGNCSSLKNITISDSVTRIGNYAFTNCSSLTSITIPESVTSIGGSVFWGCSNLNTIVLRGQVLDIGGGIKKDGIFVNGMYMIGNNNTLFILGTGTIPNYTPKSSAPWKSSEITRAIIFEGITGIGNYAFTNCNSLTSITIPESVTSIGINAFSGCNCIEAVHISSIETLLTINYSNDGSYPAFGHSCSLYIESEEITSLEIPIGYTSIDYCVLSGYTGLISITIPDSVTSIGAYAFCGCSGLTKITIPDSVTSIGESAFFHCDRLNSITIPNSVTSIGSYAFEECRSLTSIIIPICNSYAHHWVIANELPVDILEHQQVVTDSPVTPDCETEGATEGSHCETCGSILVAQEIIPALGHVWSVPSYAWNAANTEVTATHVCSRDANHTETEIASVAAQVTTQPTCEIAGLTTYTSAAFINEAFSVQTRTSTIAALGHEWGEVSYNFTWNEVNMEVTASRVCIHDAAHVETETVPMTVRVTKQPTCSEMGWTTYTSEPFANEVFEQQIKTLANIEKLPHTPATDPAVEPTCVTTGLTEGSHCAVCGEILTEQKIVPTSAHTYQIVPAVAATCEEPGFSSFVNCIVCGQVLIESTEEPALGHVWGNATYTWNDDNTEVSATCACTRDPSHIHKESVAVMRIATVSPTQTEEGQFKFVSEPFGIEAFTVQEKQGGTIPALNTLTAPSLPSQLTTIADEAFENTPFEAVIIPDTVSTIGHCAFENCSRLVYVYIPVSVTSIETDAFVGCPNVIIDRASE